MRLRPIALAALLLAAPALAQPLTTAFTFQGRLANGSAPGQGNFDLRFRLYDAATAGNQLGPALCSDNVPVADGLATVLLDFGSQFAGQRRWLEVDVRPDTGLTCANAAGFTTLAPRQELTAIPHASYALAAATAQSAANATTATNATQLNGQAASFYQNAANLTSGTIPGSRLSGAYANPLTLNNASNAFTGSFSGSGAGLTNIPFSGLTGVPATVSLQNSTPGTAQTGNLNVAGEGLFSGVGIGTTSPATPLHIVDPSVAQLKLERTGGASLLLQAGTTVTRVGSTTTTRLGFLIGGNDQMTLDTAGHLGIGTASPDTNLHVFRASAGAITANANAPLVVENNANCYLNLFAPDANESGLLFGRQGALLSNAAAGVFFNSTGNTDGLQFRTGSTATAMTIDNLGRVGIGTTDPTATLHVNGSISFPGGSLNAFEMADEPGVACDIRNADGGFQFFSGLHTAASRSLICPANGYVLAIGTVMLVGDNVFDTTLIMGLSTSSSGLPTNNRHLVHILSGKAHVVPIQGLFSVAAGNKEIFLFVQPTESGRSLECGAAHLTLIYLPTAYGTVDSD